MRAGILGKEELMIMSNQTLPKTKNLATLKFLGEWSGERDFLIQIESLEICLLHREVTVCILELV